jgi:hypothetical protein
MDVVASLFLNLFNLSKNSKDLPEFADKNAEAHRVARNLIGACSYNRPFIVLKEFSKVENATFNKMNIFC